MLRNLIVMSILVPGFFLALKDRFNALLLYLWFAFFRPQDWMYFDISVLKPSLVLGLVLIVPSILTGILPDLTHPLSVGALAFLGSSFLAQFNAVNAEMGWNWIDFLTRLLLVCLLTTTLVTNGRRLVAVLAVTAGSFGVHAAKAGLVSMLSGGVRFFDGLAGAFVDNNGYACGTVMIMPFLLAIAENIDYVIPENRPTLRVWGRRAFLIAVPLCGFTVISTFSRGGFLALAASTLVYVALHRRRVRLAMSLSAIAVIGLLFVPMPKGYADRLDTLNSYEDDEGSALSRFHFWQVAMAMADAQPLGIGLRNYEFAYDTYDFSNGRFGHNRAVHSSHFQVLAELGYPGAAIWIGEFGLAFIIALRLRGKAKTPGLPPEASRLIASVSTAVVVSMAGFLVGGSFLAMALNDVTWLTFALLAALDRVAARMILEAKRSPARETPVVRPAFVPVVRRPAALGTAGKAS